MKNFYGGLLSLFPFKCVMTLILCMVMCGLAYFLGQTYVKSDGLNLISNSYAGGVLEYGSLRVPTTTAAINDYYVDDKKNKVERNVNGSFMGAEGVNDRFDDESIGSHGLIDDGLYSFGEPNERNLYSDVYISGSVGFTLE